jgi:hypothetical protein
VNELSGLQSAHLPPGRFVRFLYIRSIASRRHCLFHVPLLLFLFNASDIFLSLTWKDCETNLWRCLSVVPRADSVVIEALSILQLSSTGATNPHKSEASNNMRKEQ